MQADDYSGGRIERIDLGTGVVECLYRAAGEVPLKGPNDLVFDAQGGFYFSDLGKVRAREMDRGAVYYRYGRRLVQHRSRVPDDHAEWRRTFTR